MVINTNMGANSAARLLSESTGRLNKALTRLASGSKLFRLPTMRPGWLWRANSMRKFRVIEAFKTT